MLKALFVNTVLRFVGFYVDRFDIKISEVNSKKCVQFLIIHRLGDLFKYIIIMLIELYIKRIKVKKNL